MPEHSNTRNVACSQEEMILSCQPWMQKLAYRYARNQYRVEYEDLVQIAMVAICTAAPQALQVATNPMAYLRKCGEYAMVDELRRMHVPPDSLEAPLTSDGLFSLADLLPDRSQVPGSRAAARRGQAVRDAVKRLGPTQRRSIKYVYGFTGVGRHTDSQAAGVLGVSRNAVNKAIQRGRESLYADALLCKEVGVEVQA